jgi:hypothetical protein
MSDEQHFDEKFTVEKLFTEEYHDDDPLLGFQVNESDREAIAVNLHAALVHNIVTFYYRKADGTLRKAVGTLNPAYIPPVVFDKYMKARKELANAWTKVFQLTLADQRMPTNAFDLAELYEALKETNVVIGTLTKVYAESPALSDEELQLYVTYYDFIAQGFRKCRKDSILAMSY